MIARLRGTLVERDAAEVVVDVGGVGYEVTCSTQTLAGLPAIGEVVTLRVFTHATENKIKLFGFGDAAERALFDLLITVKNVGPSTAIAILSGGATVRELAELIARQDARTLTKIKGVGKRTADLLVVELHERCEALLLTWNVDGAVTLVARAPTGRPPRHPLLDEVAAAMVGMGWRPVEAEQAVAALIEAEGGGEIAADATLESLLRSALRSMPR
ncbi:MAG: Holliday junction branch migration protein RuvA [Kofleriaceae bacterium]